jgi:DNA invertase Pin-like site-specific DNA recombinase
MEEAKGRVVGYARTSTDRQNLALQLDALRAAGAAEIFQDQVSGARTKRPGLDKALAALQPSDTLAVWKLDRLGRSLHHLIGVVAELTSRGVAFRSLTENIDTGTSHGRMLLGLFGTLAEFERDLIKERIAAGRAAAKRRGQKFGPTPLLSVSQVDLARREMAGGRRPLDVAKDLRVSRATLYAALARDDERRALEASTAWTRRRPGRPSKKAAIVAEVT